MCRYSKIIFAKLSCKNENMRTLMKPKDNLSRRILVMCAGIALMGAGVILFKFSLMGNGPSTAMAIAIADRIGIDFSITIIVFQCLCFLAEFIWGRRMIGIGTFVNWFFVGPLASLYERGIRSVWTVPDAVHWRWLFMTAGILVLSLAGALYQTADVGIAPYDTVSLILSEKSGKKYFWCRIITDSVCVAVTFLCGGIVGIGTLICAMGLGPFIHFFSDHIARPLVGGGSGRQI